MLLSCKCQSYPQMLTWLLRLSVTRCSRDVAFGLSTRNSAAGNCTGLYWKNLFWPDYLLYKGSLAYETHFLHNSKHFKIKLGGMYVYTVCTCMCLYVYIHTRLQVWCRVMSHSCYFKGPYRDGHWKLAAAINAVVHCIG